MANSRLFNTISNTFQKVYGFINNRCLYGLHPWSGKYSRQICFNTNITVFGILWCCKRTSSNEKKDEISLSDAIEFPFYFGSPDDLPLTYKAMADKGITLYKGERMTRLKYILSLFSNQNYLFPIMPGAKIAFEENLIDLCIKIPIQFENRLIIKKEFTNSPKLKILLSGIKSTHERCKNIYPGWIASLL